MADLQKRIRVLDQAVASGNRSTEVFERNMIKAGNAELAAQKIEFETKLAPQEYPKNKI